MSVRTARCVHGWRWYAACPDCASEELLARLEWDERHGVIGRLRRKVLEQMWAGLVDPDPNPPRPGDGTWTGLSYVVKREEIQRQERPKDNAGNPLPFGWP